MRTGRAEIPFFSVKGILRRREIQGELPTSSYAYRNLLTIAIPSMIELIFTSLINTCDMLMVSSLGTYAITSIGITNQPRMIVMVLFMAVNTGVTSIVARTKGEGNPGEACRCLRQALMMVILLDAVVLTTAIVFAPEFLVFAGANEECLPYATDYFRIIVAGLSVQQFGACIVAAQRGAGNTKISLVISVLSNAVNILFNYFLILGNCGFPRLEIKGAAIASVMGYFSGFVVAVISMIRSRDVIAARYCPDRWRPNPAMLKRIWRVAGNAMIEQVGFRIGFFMFAQIVASLGTDAFATHQICMQVMEFSFVIGDALSIASTSLVGQNLGKKRQDLAYLYSGIAQRIGIAASCLIFFLFFFAGEFFMRLFTDVPEVIQLGIQIMRLCAFAQFFQIYRVIICGCLRGAGDNRFLAVVSLIGVAILRPGLSIVLVNWLNYGLMGAWIATLVDMALRAVATSLRFLSGKWVNKVV